MSRYACPTRLLAPRSHVPNELGSAYVGNIQDGALACAYLIKRRILGQRKYKRIVVVDIDGSVYAARPESASVDLLIIMHPELVVGTYDARVAVSDIAADLETFRRSV